MTIDDSYGNRKDPYVPRVTKMLALEEQAREKGKLDIEITCMKMGKMTGYG